MIPTPQAQPRADATGFVLAGGRSRRMGRDKALLPWGAGHLLGHALERMRAVCSEVVILSGEERRYLEAGAPVLADVMSGSGPLGGLVTALEHARTELAVLLAVDVPFAPPALLRRLVELADDADAVVPVSAGRPQPLCAVYRRRCGAAARRRVAAGELKMTSFWPDVRVRQVSEDELAPFGSPELLLRNLNSPQDYELSRPQPV